MIEENLVCRAQLSDALRMRKLVARRRTWAQGVEDQNHIIRVAKNRVAVRNDLIGDDYSVAVEMMDSDDGLRGL